MVYLNQAATTWPKPPRVLEAHAAALSAPPAGQFRGGAGASGADAAERCRGALGRLLGIRAAGRIYFSCGATDSLNALIRGLPLKGRRVIATRTEHNSVLRPLMNLKGSVGAVDIAPCDSDGRVDPGVIEDMLGGDVAAVFVNHCSNVTGAIQDLGAIGEVAHRHGALLVVDVAQSAGCVSVDAEGWGVDALAFAGHKGLFGVQGVGGHYVREGVPFVPSRFGGTGRDSRRLVYDGDYEYEVGTQNLPGISALCAGVEYILERGVSSIAATERALVERMIEGLRRVPGVRLVGEGLVERGPVLSFNIDGLDPADVAYILQSGYGITVRAGLHCAPLIHGATGTAEKGTVRASVSCMNAEADVDRLADAVGEIAGGLEAAREDR